MPGSPSQVSDRWREVEINDGEKVVVYDKENSDAWVESTLFFGAEELR